MSYRFLIIGSICLLGLCCTRMLGEDYNLEKTSPNGTYRVEVKIRAEKPKGTRAHTEHGKIQFFKGQELIDTHEWEEADQWEPSFRDTKPVIEWIDDRVLRMGRDRSTQPFLDEAIISNASNEHLKYIDVTYSRSESFKVFDLPPGGRIVLHMSPEFASNSSSNTSVGCGGMSQSGKKFECIVEGKENRTPADGQSKFRITIQASDLH